jgi:hypothetical protein
MVSARRARLVGRLDCSNISWVQGNYGSPSLGWVQKMKIMYKADQTVSFFGVRDRQGTIQSWEQNRHYSSPLLVNNDQILESTSNVVTSNDLVLYNYCLRNSLQYG